MPSNHGLRLDDDEAVSPSRPGAGKPEPRDAVTLEQPWTLGPPAQDDQLLAEGEILGDKVGFLGEKSANDSLDDPKTEHRHLLAQESVPEYTRAGSSARF
jgi:hypothetical protein